MGVGRVKSVAKAETAQEGRGHNAGPTETNPAHGEVNEARWVRAAGNLAIQRLFHVGTIKAMLTIDRPGDPFEEEADQIAAQIMRMPETAIDTNPPPEPQTQQRLGSGDSDEQKRDPFVEEGEVRPKSDIPTLPFREQAIEGGGRLQAQSVSAGITTATPEVENAIHALRNRGQLLPNAVRSFMEPRFKTDFGAIRIHTDSHAHDLARSIGAQAFTLGRDIVFGAGFYAPQTERGNRLIAHELAHVEQQSGEQQRSGNLTVAGLSRPAVRRGRAVARRAIGVQRQLAPSPKAIGLYWRGVEVSTDRSSIRKQLEGLVEKGGLGALRRWIQGFLAVDRKVLSAAARSLSDADVDAIVTAVSETNLELEADAKTFVDGLGPRATAIANGILDASEERIERELEHYGIKETEMPPDEGGGGAEGGPSYYESRVTMEDKEAGQNAQRRARALAEARRAADKAQREYNKLVEIPGMSEVEKAVRRELPELKTRFRVAEDNWKTAEDLYAKQAMAATQKFPILAMYASGENVAARLDAFASQPVEQLGETIWRESRRRLENIKTVRSELGGRFNPLFNQRILDLTLAKEDVKGWQKRIGRDHVAAAKGKAEEDQMFWTAIAIGLGLIAAIPTGGTSLVAAGLVTAAGIAGAALSVYNAYEHWHEYQLQSAAAETDYAKAEALAKDEPSLLWLAIDIIGAGLELGAAAAAFRALSTTVKAAKAGDVSAAIKVAKVADSVGITGAAKTKIVGETVAGLSEEAIEQAARTMARSGGMTQREHIARLMAGLAERGQFKGELQKAIELMEHVRGRIPDTARKMVAEGRVRVFNEASLIDAYGPVKGPEMWTKYAYADGFHSKELDIIFLRPSGSTEDLAGALIHEAMHRIGTANPVRGNDFMSEAIAEFAERDFYMTLYAEGGPLAGKAPKSARIQQFLSWSDEQLMHNIEVRYFEAKKHLSPMKRAKFKNVAGESADEIVKSIFDDIAADYGARLVNE